MGNATHVTERLDAFLKHDTKRVLLLRGAWGVGKSYFWSNVYLPGRIRAGGVISEARHAYVSLFGVQTPQEIEQLVLAKSTELSGAPAKRRLLGASRKAASYLDDIPKLKEYAGFIQRLGHMCIQNTLVCIDDIERKASSLTMEGVLGLVSVLREHNGCRFVLIMNDSGLAKQDLEQLDLYKEKVIDETITFSPNVTENCGLIFGDGQHLELSRSVLERLGMNNIRVMQQASWAIEHFEPQLKGFEPAAASHVLEHVVQLACFHFDPRLGVDVDNLPKDSFLSYFLKKDDEDDDEAKKLDRLMRQYCYEPAEFDQYIVQYLKWGEYDATALAEKLASENEREKHSQVVTKYRAVWSAYNGSFLVDGPTFSARVAEFLDAHSDTLTQKEFDQMLEMLVDVGGQELLDDQGASWKDAFVAGRIDRSGGKHLDQLAELTENTELLARIKQRRKSLAEGFSISAAICKVVDDSGWNPETVKKLASAAVDDMRQSILECAEEHFLAALNHFCNSWHQSGEGEKQAEQKVEQALMQIAEMSPINRMRARMVIPWAFESEAKPGKDSAAEVVDECGDD